MKKDVDSNAILSKIDSSAGWRINKQTRNSLFTHAVLHDSDLGTFNQWQSILDEILRLSNPYFIFTIDLKFRQSSIASLHHVANFLYRKPGFNVNCIFRERNELIHVIIEVERTASVPIFSGITFGILSDGRRKDYAADLINSICDSNKQLDSPVEFIVIAKEKLHTPNPVDYINQEQLRISEKKNLIVQRASYSHVAIFHDRYKVPADFIKNIYDYGPDFDVLSCVQRDIDGYRIGDFVATNSQWSWSKSMLLDYSDSNLFNYINGGFILGRKEVLSDVVWNPLLDWNEAEDIEHSRALVNNGYQPRFTESIEISSVVSREGYLESFAILPYTPRKFGLVTPHPDEFFSHTSHIRLGERFSFNKVNWEDLYFSGIYLHQSEWELRKNFISALKETTLLQLRLSTSDIGSNLRVKFNKGRKNMMVLDIQDSDEFVTIKTKCLPKKIYEIEVFKE